MLARSVRAVGALVAALRGYGAHPRPRAAIANTVALVVASNQPFYPLYLYGAVSPTVYPSAVTFLSTPLFLAVPALSRRSPAWGSSLLLLAGLGNTLACRVAFGPGSGVEAFALPCILLALLLFERSRRALSYGFVALAFACCLVPDAALPAPLHLYGAAEYAALRRLNLLSAASLTALLGLLFGRLMSTKPPDDETGPPSRA